MLASPYNIITSSVNIRVGSVGSAHQTITSTLIILVAVANILLHAYLKQDKLEKIIIKPCNGKSCFQPSPYLFNFSIPKERP
jgi:hypothetical protein